MISVIEADRCIPSERDLLDMARTTIRVRCRMGRRYRDPNTCAIHAAREARLCCERVVRQERNRISRSLARKAIEGAVIDAISVVLALAEDAA